MTVNKNIIRKAAVNFQFNSGEDGMTLQHDTTEWCRNLLGPALDNALQEFEQNDEVITLEKIRLDFNLESIGEWKNGLAEKIVSGLKDKLHSAITKKEMGVIFRTSHKRTEEELLYYFKTGMLPWSSAITTHGELKERFVHWLSNSSATDIKDFFLQVIEENASKRIVDMLSLQDMEIFLPTAIDDNREIISVIYKDVRTITGYIAGSELQHKKWVDSFTQTLISNRSAAVAVQLWLTELAINYPEEVQKIIPDVLTGTLVKDSLIQLQLNSLPITKNPIIEKEQPMVKPFELTKNTIIPAVPNTSEPEPIPGETKAWIPTESLGQNGINDIGIGQKTENPLIQKSFTETLSRDVELEKELAEGVFINNAGVVIIAPFIYPLFSRLGLLKDHTIKEMDKAICLLYYCITGKTSPAEFELALLKILLGSETNRVTETWIGVEEDQLKEADNMLVAVIEHWAILKNTTIEGFRETFLQRNGKLSFNNDSWLLQVEQKTYDILLQHLPWNITMIKLPWMKYILRTEWK